MSASSTCSPQSSVTGYFGNNAIFEGPYWPEPISVIAQPVSPHGFVTVEAVGLNTQKHYTTTLPSPLWETLRAERAEYTFNAPGQPFRLALEAERLRLADLSPTKRTIERSDADQIFYQFLGQNPISRWTNPSSRP